MKLHVGSGPHYVDGWINMDLNSFEGWEKQPDVLGNVFYLPFADNSMDKVYIGHVLEHLVYERVPQALHEVQRVCRPDGLICVVGPCMSKAIATGQPSWLLDEIPAGWNDPNTNPEDLAGFPHLWTSTTELTLEVMNLAGLSNVHEVPITSITLPEWANTAPAYPPLVGMWQVAVLASP